MGGSRPASWRWEGRSRSEEGESGGVPTGYTQSAQKLRHPVCMSREACNKTKVKKIVKAKSQKNVFFLLFCVIPGDCPVGSPKFLGEGMTV